EGADVAFTYFEGEWDDAEQTVQAIKEEGKEALALKCDVRDPDMCQSAVDQTINRFGKLDLLVNNAAYQKHREELEEVSIEQWDRTFQTNIYGYFYMVKAAMPHLRRG